MRILSLVIAATLLGAPAPALSEGLSFRGLNSASQRVDVLKVFPAARTQNYCDSVETVSRNGGGLKLCEELVVDGYSLDGVSFDLTFIFNTDGTLRYISLLKLYGGLRTDVGSVDAGTISSTFRSLSDLLSSKYGPAVSVSPSYILNRELNQNLEWQPGRGTTWQDGGDRISLSSDGVKSKTTAGLFRGSVSIFYTFAKRDEFAKF